MYARCVKAVYRNRTRAGSDLGPLETVVSLVPGFKLARQEAVTYPLGGHRLPSNVSATET